MVPHRSGYVPSRPYSAGGNSYAATSAAGTAYGGPSRRAEREKNRRLAQGLGGLEDNPAWVRLGPGGCWSCIPCQ